MATVSAGDLGVLVRHFDSEHPGVVLRAGAGFLRTAAIVDGFRRITTEEELRGFFESFGDVRAVVADKEGYGGERVGLVVFPDDGSCSAAISQPDPTNYHCIIPVSSIGIGQECLIEAVRGPNKTRSDNQFRNMRSLMGVLFTVKPEVADDPTFLERSVLLRGITTTTTPSDLKERCFPGHVQVAVIVRDSETSERLGLVVFAEAGDVGVAKNLPPCPGFYRRCVPACSVHRTLQTVLEGSDDHERRKGTAATMRSLIPPWYLQSDDFHLRCIFLRSSRLLDLSKGVYNLCCVAEKNLLATSTVCAAVVSEALDAAILVYDDAGSTDEASSRASRLPAGSLVMYDSSLFPMPAGEVTAGGSDQVPERGMVPEHFAQPEYLGRTVLLRGIDTAQCDAREIAYHITGCKVEALYLFRAERQVHAVFGSQRDACLVRLRRPGAWTRTCGWPIEFEDLGEAYFRPTVPAPAPEQECAAPPYPGVPHEAIELVEKVVMLSIEKRRSDDAKGIAEGLIRLAALSRHDVLRHKHFSFRAVLLMGIHAGTSRSDLCSGLGSTFGEVNELALHSEKGVALAVFKSWTAAAKLLRQPAETWRRFGVDRCRPIPGAVDVASLVNGASDMVLRFGETYGRVVRMVATRPASEAPAGG